MKLRHQLKEHNAEREVEASSPLGFLISNKAGGMLFFDARRDRTQFYATVDGKPLKIVHNLAASGKVTSVSHKFHSLEIKRQADTHELFVPHYMNALLISSKADEPLRLVMELKELNEAGKMLQILEALKEIIPAGLEKLAPVMGEIAKPLGNVDRISIVDIGGDGNSGGALAKFAKVGPSTLLQLFEMFKALGIDTTKLQDLLKMKQIEGGTTEKSE